MRGLALSAACCCVASTTALAQAGKLEGVVRDTAGTPLHGAQVVIVGTAFSATTSERGYYFINNIPPGTVAARIRLIGYAPIELQGIRMLAGQTITQDAQLEVAPLQLEDLTVSTVGVPLVPRDEVTTKQRIDGEFTENLPIDQVNQALALQPGVVASPTGNSFSIRGGRPDEAAVYLDGVSVQPGNRGNGIVAAGTNSKAGGWISTMTGYNNTVLAANPGAGSSSNAGVTIASNGFVEASVTTGAAAAQYGNAQAGIVNLATATGGSHLSGRLAAESDAVFGNTMGMGYNRFEANLGGPIVVKGLSFNVAGAAEGNLSARSGKGREDFPVFISTGVDTTVMNGNDSLGYTPVDVNSYSVYSGNCGEFAGSSRSDIANNNGDPCHGARLPGSSFSSYQVNGNINWSYGNGSRLRLGGAFSQTQGKNFNYGVVLNPDIAANQQTGFRAQNAVWTLNWTQNLATSAERALALDVNFSYQTDRFIQSPFANGGPGAGTLGFYFAPIPLQFGFDLLSSTTTIEGQALTRLDCFIRNILSCSGVLPFDNADSVNAHQPHATFRSNPYGVQTAFFPDGGLSDARLQLYAESRWVTNASLDWQMDRYNRIQLGGDFFAYSMTSYSQLIASQGGADLWKEKPVRFGVFAQDRLDIGDVVLQVGVRYDYFDTRASRWSGFPRISTNPALDSLPPGTDPTVLYVPDQSFSELSPRIQVAFPVTERTNFRLSYAQAVQTPDFAAVFSGINTDVGVSGSGFAFGQNVGFGKSKIFEFGIQHAFSDDMVLDFAAYNRDNLANAASRLLKAFDPLNQQAVDLPLLTNADFGNTKGFDLRLNRRFGQLFNGTIGYSFSSAQNTGSDPYSYLLAGAVNQVAGGNQPPPQATAPTLLSRPHNLTGSLALTFPDRWNAGSTIGSILQNVSAFVAFRFASGTAFSGCESSSGNEDVRSPFPCNRGGLQGGINSLRLPSFRQLDLRLVKGFNLGRNQVSAYLDARNILNLTNVLTQYVTTRSITSQVEKEQSFTADSTLFATEAIANDLYGEDGSIDLRFGGAGASGCGQWVNQANLPMVPNCVYLSRAEARWGNGDGSFTLAEQQRASNALYYSALAAPTFFYGAGTQLRLGIELNF